MPCVTDHLPAYQDIVTNFGLFGHDDGIECHVEVSASPSSCMLIKYYHPPPPIPHARTQTLTSSSTPCRTPQRHTGRAALICCITNHLLTLGPYITSIFEDASPPSKSCVKNLTVQVQAGGIISCACWGCRRWRLFCEGRLLGSSPRPQYEVFTRELIICLAHYIRYDSRL